MVREATYEARLMKLRLTLLRLPKFGYRRSILHGSLTMKLNCSFISVRIKRSLRVHLIFSLLCLKKEKKCAGSVARTKNRENRR